MNSAPTPPKPVISRTNTDKICKNWQQKKDGITCTSGFSVFRGYTEDTDTEKEKSSSHFHEYTQGVENHLKIWLRVKTLETSQEF